MDGEHYGLLTDFGYHTDLEDAPVIRIAPMYSERVYLVARNIKDFFSLHFFDELVLLGEYVDDNEYLERVRQEETKDLNSAWFNHDRWKMEKEMAIHEVQKKFNLQPISNPVAYIQEARMERQLQATTPTLDNLGIIPYAKVTSEEDLQLFASIRNLQFHACNDPVIVHQHADGLLQRGMKHEAESLITRLIF